MPPSSTKICGAPRATVSAAIVAPNISTYHSADALGFSLMMWTWSNLNAGLLIAWLSALARRSITARRFWGDRRSAIVAAADGGHPNGEKWLPADRRRDARDGAGRS